METSGRGSTRASGFRRVPPAVGAGPLSIATGDFDGNGAPDLMAVSAASRTVSVLLGNGDGTFKAATSIQILQQPLWVATGDFNADGKVDFVDVNAGDPNAAM